MNGRGGCCWAPQPRTHHGFGGHCRSEGAITTAAASADVRRSAGSLRGIRQTCVSFIDDHPRAVVRLSMFKEFVGKWVATD